MKRLTLVTDAWHPQTNGVVNTLTRLVKDLAAQGTDVQVICPDGHKTVPLPSYPEYRVAVDPWKALPRIRAFKPDAIHIATEGPLGFWTNGFLRRRKLRFTTSFHTRFPDYLAERLPMPGRWTNELTWSWLRRFHAPIQQCASLAARGRCRAIPPAHWRGSQAAPADLFDRRAVGGGKEPRGISCP